MSAVPTTESQTFQPDSTSTALLDAVGNTPLLPLHRIGAELRPGVRLLAKAEWLNPSGSVKDRPAAAILQRGLEEGDFADGRALLDSTSGNMGISYSTFGASLGIGIHLAVPANASPSRLAILKSLGANLILTDPSEGSDGARLVAQSLAHEQAERFLFVDQYSNPANWQAHFSGTGPEIADQTSGELTHFVAGLGTGGSMVGTGRYFRQERLDIELVAVQPDGPMHGMEGLKHYETSMIPEIYDASIPDRTMFVATDSAYEMTRRLAREEGMFVGVSAGAAVYAALAVARDLVHGSVVVLLPDSGHRYLNESFWEAERP